MAIRKKIKPKRTRRTVTGRTVTGRVLKAQANLSINKKIKSTKTERIVKVEKTRSDFKKIMLENPNYFGTFPETKLKAVVPTKSNKKYEDIDCLGFYPEEDLLEAVINIKSSSGYQGDLCSTGSFEYIRFYIDWNGNGNFSDAGDDVGITSINVHDIPNGKEACLEGAKPLSYAVKLKIDSKKNSCKSPNIVKVRAILSWDLPPTPGNPNFIPVWGVVVDKWIQIKPRALVIGDILKKSDMIKLKIDPEMLDLKKPISIEKTLEPLQLKKLYEGKKVPEHRYHFAKYHSIIEKVKLNSALVVEYPELKNVLKDLVLFPQDMKVDKTSTKYEQLNCVGLNYDTDTLEAALTIKSPYGYNGDLCSKGGYEYVAFWAFVWDQIEQMCRWKYLGGSRVNVHDFDKMPSDGLQYSVYLNTDLSEFRDKCTNPKVMKVRAILSWQVPPPSNDPDYNPVWGNRVDALVQIKPGENVAPGIQKPYIWSVGQMAVESISGNPYTVTGSSIGDGYGNGPSVGGGYNAVESPFGGTAAISGTITNPPNNPADADKLKYKLQYKKVGDPNWGDITNGFRIWIRTDGVPSGDLDQVADVDGHFKYQKDLTAPIINEVQNDMLAHWQTQKAIGGDGIYEIRMLLFQSGASEPGVPADHVASNTVKVMVDNTSPSAKISLDDGACTEFTVGDDFTGKFTATDLHIWKYALSITPGVPNPPVIDPPTTENYPALAAPGKVDESFTIRTTSTTTSCGYVVRLYVWDRTIRNNSMSGNQNYDDVGLCLRKKQ